MRLPPSRRPAASTARRLLAAALGVSLALAAAAPDAGAVITESSITQPSTSPLFGIVNEDEVGPYPLTIAGTSDSTVPLSDRLEVGCYSEGDTVHGPLYLGVEPSLVDGSFSVQIEENSITQRLCHLLALPEGTSSDPHAFSGPVTALGVARTSYVGSAHNPAAPEDFWLDDEQLEGAGDYESLSGCGLVDTRLFTAAIESPTATFNCTDWYAPYDQIDPAHSSRSEIQVDGADAFAAYGASELAPEAQEFPALEWHYSQDPGNGDVKIEEGDQLSVCPGHAYPPESCPEFADSGVSDARTIEQTDGGRLVTITDSFTSNDGQPHSLDLEPQQGAKLSASSPHQVALRFPGESDFSVHGPGESVAFAPSGPGIVYLRTPGAADGDPETGQAAIVFDRSSSPATFNTVIAEGAEFHFHQQVAVPATGAATVRFAYASGFTAAEVEAKAKAVATSFGWTEGSEEQGSGGTGGSSGAGSGTPAESRPSNAFRLLAHQLNPARGTAILTVAVPGPGAVRLVGKGVRSVRRRARSAGKLKLAVRPARGLAKLLGRRHRARVRVQVTFTPDGGSARTRAIRLTLRERSSR